ncbi:hypothetical protein MTO96_031489 [Rhipicephalus appendiculatus]
MHFSESGRRVAAAPSGGGRNVQTRSQTQGQRAGVQQQVTRIAHICAVCHRQFETQRGLSVHCTRAKHKVHQVAAAEDGTDTTSVTGQNETETRRSFNEAIQGSEGTAATAANRCPVEETSSDSQGAPPDTPVPGPSVVHGSVWGVSGERPSGRRRRRLPPSLLAELLSDSDTDETDDGTVFYSGLLEQSDDSQSERGTEAALRCLENAAPADGISAPRRGFSGARQSSATAGVQHEICTECGRAFQTKSGLSQHRRHRHLEAYNADINVERSKPRWTREENYLMARFEADLHKQNVRNINERLAERFPARTFDGIKSHRRAQGYRDLVAQLLNADRAASRQPVSQDDDGQATMEVDQSARSVVTEELMNLTQRTPPRSFQAARLWEVTKRFLEGQAISQALNDYLRDVFAEDERGASRAPRRPQHESNRQRKKREYAETQRLFKKAQTRCARKILDGSAESCVSDPADFLMAWRSIMEVRQEAVVSPHPETPSSTFNPQTLITAAEIKSAMLPINSASGPDGFSAKRLKAVPMVVLRVLLNVPHAPKKAANIPVPGEDNLHPESSECKSALRTSSDHYLTCVGATPT